eukprot:TRINITY_DN50532_c0_g1_i1.p2 TRINITY_DN50532_c0_g1~~TRINITY_DN50532_c0_g1_i1.p2  ORF type:complete len:111 (+),score=8.83 TRINITY_DN50532_c0_g1_i1:1-333(+)
MYLKVSVGLHELGIQHEQKKVINQCGCVVAASFKNPSSDGTVLVLVGSQYRYYSNIPDMPTGQLLAQKRCLEIAGFNVLLLPATQLEQLIQKEHIAQFLQYNMEQCGFFE